MLSHCWIAFRLYIKPSRLLANAVVPRYNLCKCLHNARAAELGLSQIGTPLYRVLQNWYGKPKGGDSRAHSEKVKYCVIMCVCGFLVKY